MKAPISSAASSLILSVALFQTAAVAGDWPNWLGPNRNNVAAVSPTFVADVAKLRTAWKMNVGLGYSTFAVVNGKAFTMGHDGKGAENVLCLDAASGKELWRRTYNAELLPKMHTGGPNATPTVAGDRVITVGKDGVVLALSADKGAELWRANLVESLGVKLPNWGFASSPVVEGDLILLSGGKVGAFDVKTGKAVWVSKAEQLAGYTTPVVFQQGGKKFVAVLDGKGLSIFSLADGAELARHPFKANFDMNATTPYAIGTGGQLFVSGNMGSELVKFDGKALSVVWASTELKAGLNNPVVTGDMIYGIDGRQGTPSSRFVAVSLADGKLKWSKDGFGFGTTVGAGRHVVALTENGELVSVKMGAEGYSEVSRQQVLGKTCWTTPVVAGDRIYVRNDKGDVVCLSGS